MGSVTVRVDDATKEQAAAIAANFGFDLSSVTRAFYLQMIREDRIPLNLSYGEPNYESLEALAEAQVISDGRESRFGDVDEMLDALGVNGS